MRIGRIRRGRPGIARGAGTLVALGALASAGAQARDPQTNGADATPGTQVYMAQCASCHGAAGEGFIGPPVIGPEAALGVYENGRRLLDYISTTMPQANPGGLSDEQYREVLAFLLIRNGFVEPDWISEKKPPDQIPLSR
jgi:mono/diheme cytochrome c family protein